MTESQKKHAEIFVHQSIKAGNTLCGDSYFFTETDEYLICVIADGLGSGELAHEASHTVIDFIEHHHHLSVDYLMKECNERLREKRGAAVLVFKAYFHTYEFEYSCVGNIRFYLKHPSGRLIYPLPVLGYLSGRPQKYHTQRFSYEPESKFLIHSDGFVFKDVKTILKPFVTVEMISNQLKTNMQLTNDDATVIIGSLL
ncbi:PP2C family serine/threonine-protein phosphatase [Pseudoneobacillus sp. C159]